MNLCSEREKNICFHNNVSPIIGVVNVNARLCKKARSEFFFPSLGHFYFFSWVIEISKYFKCELRHLGSKMFRCYFHNTTSCYFEVYLALQEN